MRRTCACWLPMVALGLGLVVVPLSLVASAAPGTNEPSAERTYQQVLDRAIQFLQTKGQTPEGAYAPQAGPGVTAVVTAGLLRNGRGPADPLVAKSLKYLEGMVKPDGGIYQENSQYRNYETCLAILCFAEANRDGHYTTLLKRADAFVKGIQWDEGEGVKRDDPSYGGAGYGGHNRPDLSNTSFLMDALKAVGNGPTMRRSRRHSSSFRAARTWRRRTTRPPLRPRIPTAASTTRWPPVAPAWPARLPKAACAATAR